MRRTSITLTVILLATLVVTFFACSKYSSGDNPASNTTPKDEIVTASLQGRVLDENGLPVKDAAVTSGAAGTTTDVNGIFTFTDISMSSRFGYVKVVKQGYFAGARTILTNAGGQNYVTIHLLPRVLKGSFVAGTGGIITVGTGNTVSFEGNAVVNAATNAPYAGNVNVYATYIDPTDEDLPNHMPGTLRGIDTTGKETGLRSYGMMGVELEGDGGEKLQIAPGNRAILTMAIPAALQASAPNSIPLWYFSDSSGKWMEEGGAARQGNSYVGLVGHFSYWNVDLPTELVTFNIHLKDQHGNALAYTYIKITYPAYGLSDGVYTDSSGYAFGFIGKGLTALLQVMSPCNTLLYGANIGPALTNLDLGSPTVEIASASLVLNGTVVDCSNNPITNGYVNAYVEGLYYRSPVTNGNFSLTLNRCSVAATPVQLTPGDYGTGQQGTATTVSATTGSKDVGQLTVCTGSQNSGPDEYIHISFRGNNYSLEHPGDTVGLEQYSLGLLWGEAKNPSNPLTLVNFFLDGIYSDNDLHIGGSGYPDGGSFINVQNQRYDTYATNDLIHYELTSVDSVGGYITGTLTGTMSVNADSTGERFPITGSFKIKHRPRSE